MPRSIGTCSRIICDGTDVVKKSLMKRVSYVETNNNDRANNKSGYDLLNLGKNGIIIIVSKAGRIIKDTSFVSMAIEMLIDKRNSHTGRPLLE